MAAHVYHQIYFHIVWTTKLRLPFITDEVRDWLIARIKKEAGDRNAEVLACNAMPDHVHLLVSLPPTVAPAAFIGQVKGSTAHAFHHEYGESRFLKWQTGYSIHSLRKNGRHAVIRYIEEQQQRHEKRDLWPSVEPREEEPGE